MDIYQREIRLLSVEKLAQALRPEQKGIKAFFIQDIPGRVTFDMIKEVPETRAWYEGISTVNGRYVTYWQAHEAIEHNPIMVENLWARMLAGYYYKKYPEWHIPQIYFAREGSFGRLVSPTEYSAVLLGAWLRKDETVHALVSGKSETLEKFLA